MNEKYYLSGIVLSVVGLMSCFAVLPSVQGEPFEPAVPIEEAGLPNQGQPETAPNSKSESGAISLSGNDVFGEVVRGRDQRKMAEKQKLQNQIREAVKKIRETKEEELKSEVITEMEELFTKYFDQEIQQREEQLAPLEKRVKKLRDQIEKRKAAKADIIGLQLKLIEHQAEGLGFFTEPETSSQPIYGYPGSTFEESGVTSPLLPESALSSEADHYATPGDVKSGNRVRPGFQPQKSKRVERTFTEPIEDF